MLIADRDHAIQSREWTIGLTKLLPDCRLYRKLSDKSAQPGQLPVCARLPANVEAVGLAATDSLLSWHWNERVICDSSTKVEQII
jgi:hypothetical protein